MTIENNLSVALEQLREEMSSPSYFIDLERIYKYKEAIFSEERSFDYNDVLSHISRTSTADKDRIQLQKELIEMTLDKGVDINSSKVYLSFDNLSNYYDVLLNHSTNPISLNKALQIILSEYVLDEKIKLKGELIKATLDRGADINSSEVYLSFDDLSNYYDVLLNHSTNPISPNKALQFILNTRVLNENEVKLQGDMLKDILDKGADINSSEVSLSFKGVVKHYDLLLNYSKNPINPNKFLKIILDELDSKSDLSKRISDVDKGNLISAALDKMAEINSFHISFDILSNHYDLLLNHSTNPISPIKALRIILNEDVPDADKIKLQGDMLKDILDKGADINSSEVSLSFENLSNHYGLLLNRAINLTKALQISLNEYVYDEDKIKLQGDLLKNILDKGADINSPEVSLNFDIISNHYDLLLNRAIHPINPTKALKTILGNPLTKYDYNLNARIPDEDKIKLQGDLLKAILDKGADINSPEVSLNFDIISNHYELLLNRSINLTKALKITLNAHVYNEDKIKLQGDLLKAILDKGADINSSEVSLSFENLSNHYDLLLNHPTNPMSQTKFFEILSLTCVIKNLDGKKAFEAKAKLVEFAYKSSFDLSKKKLLEVQVIKALADNAVIDDLTMLKLILKAYNNDENKNYDMEAIEVQKQLLETYLAKGLTIDDFSFTELNIKDNHVSILKLLLKAGLDPTVLIIHDLNKEDAVEALHIVIENNVKVSVLAFFVLFGNRNTNIDVFKLLLNHVDMKINDKFFARNMINSFTSQGVKFKEYLEELAENVDLEPLLEEHLAENGTLLHILTKSNKHELIKFILDNYTPDINSLNELGQTPLFFAKSIELVETLISYQADLNVKDKNGNIWLYNPSLELIEYVVAKNYLPKNYVERVAILHFLKGNYEHAAKLYKKIGFEFNVDPVELVVESIINGLKVSVEQNKYQAIINLVNKAGISIPSKFEHLLNSYDDGHIAEEFDFLYGLLHELAKHYINLAKAALARNIGHSEELDKAFKTRDFSALKAIHPDNLELAKITDSFSAYYAVAGKAQNILDNDLALEALTINGLRPNPLAEEITVYRGMGVNLAPDDIDSYFKYGHRRFSEGEYQKTLGFFVNQPWNKNTGKWEYGGTYVSVDASTASAYASNLSNDLNTDSMLMEIRMTKGSPTMCGSAKFAYELIPSNIAGEDIIAIYILKADKQAQVDMVYKNPYIDSEIIPRFKSNETIASDIKYIETYDKLGCKDLPSIENKDRSTLYKNYTDFLTRYTPEKYAADQMKLRSDYFYDREEYVEESNYGFNGECDLSFECCI